MTLIADSGSTKTAWALVDASGQAVGMFRTEGINPIILTDDQISTMLREQLLPQIGEREVEDIYFYGAGCRPDQLPRMTALLSEACNCSEVQVESDLLGACRALSGREEGICCILGTGSASCLYDGTLPVQQTPSLGYILGDEGSGAVLGRRLVGDALKGQLPAPLCALLEEEMGLTVSSAIEHVYRQPWPNRYLASLTPFLSQHREEPCVHQLLVEEFRRFAVRNLRAYRREELPVHFVGSIAYYFRTELEEALTLEGYRLGRIEAAPLPRLVEFHYGNRRSASSTMRR